MIDPLRVKILLHFSLLISLNKYNVIEHFHSSNTKNTNLILIPWLAGVIGPTDLNPLITHLIGKSKFQTEIPNYSSY